MDLKIYKDPYASEFIPGSIREILEMDICVVLQIDKPEEHMNPHEKNKKEAGRGVYEQIFYTDSKSGKGYCGGTFINDHFQQRHWKLDQEKGIFLEQPHNYGTRHLDKLVGDANWYHLKDSSLPTFIELVKAEGFQFQP